MQEFISDALRPVPIVADGATCIGSEDFLTDCPGFSVGNSTEVCGHADDISVVCFNGADPGALLRSVHCTLDLDLCCKASNRQLDVALLQPLGYYETIVAWPHAVSTCILDLTPGSVD